MIVDTTNGRRRQYIPWVGDSLVIQRCAPPPPPENSVQLRMLFAHSTQLSVSVQHLNSVIRVRVTTLTLIKTHFTTNDENSRSLALQSPEQSVRYGQPYDNDMI